MVLSNLNRSMIYQGGYNQLLQYHHASATSYDHDLDHAQAFFSMREEQKMLKNISLSPVGRTSVTPQMLGSGAGHG